MMEPMTMSPTSPSVGGGGGGTGGGITYLPGFLLGEAHHQEAASSPSGAAETPTRGHTLHHHHHHHLTPNATSLLANSFSPASNTPVMSKSSIPPHNRPDYNRGSKTKLDGPPIAGLFDDLNFKNATMSPAVASPANQLGTSLQMNEDSESPGFWVIVFGFPPAHQSHILSIFSQLGRVVEHSYPTNGNWMFIKYHSRMDVRKALSHNERIVSGNIMIGVSERRAKPSHKETINDSFQSLNSTPITSPNASLTSPKIRNLAVARRDNQVVSPHLVPTKDTSMVSKAMDLLFGW